MDEKEIYKNLCMYDPRNPEFQDLFGDSEEEIKEGLGERKKHIEKHGYCCCDNCFYNRTQLAEELLQMRQEIENLIYDE